MEPVVSIIVTKIGKKRELARCIDSLLQQTYTNIEIIIVTDYLSDLAAAQYLSDLAADNTARVIYTSARNPSESKKIGLASISGSYIMLIESFASVDADFVREAVTMMEANTLLSVVHASHSITDRYKRVRHFNQPFSAEMVAWESKVPPAAVIRAEKLKDGYVLDQSLGIHYDEVSVWIQALNDGAEVRYLGHHVVSVTYPDWTLQQIFPVIDPDDAARAHELLFRLHRSFFIQNYRYVVHKRLELEIAWSQLFQKLNGGWRRFLPW